MVVHTEKVLEYDKLKSLLKKYTLSQLGALRVEELKPSRQIDEIRQQQKLCSEAKALYQTSNGFPLRGLQDISPVLRKVAKPGAILEADQLLDVGRVAHVAQNVRRGLAKINASDFPNLCTIVNNLPTFVELAKSITDCISSEGEILDQASPTLRNIRRQLTNTREKIQSKLETILRSPHHQKSLQENIITLRNDRYVIPIKQDARSHFPGIVQGQSTSGATVFIEPFSIVELNNALHQLAEEERQEVRRVLFVLSEQVRECVTGLEVALDILGELDFLGAKTQLSLNLNAVEPLLNARGFVKLMSARHPLLEANLQLQARKGKTLNRPNREGDSFRRLSQSLSVPLIVPTDLHIGDSFHTIVITGPNTGGKTVVLKTIGLLTLMAQSGLHIPARSGSEIAVFDDIFADIGDEQSIEQNLSTFSSHITKIIEILKHLERSDIPDRKSEKGEKSLVLLDELGAGTDPTEGAALGMAILDRLGQSGARTIVTTHYGALKAHAHTQEGMENASMEFNWLTLSPTYRLLIGVPGSSNAIKIAQRLGMPDSITSEAKAYMGDRLVAVEDLIVSMQESQRELEAEREIVQGKVRAAETIYKKHEALISQFEVERDELKRTAEKEASEILKNARKLIERTIADVHKESASKKSVRSAVTHIENAQKELKERHQPKEQALTEPPPLPKIQVGDKVRLKGLNQFGEVVSIIKSSKAPLKVRVRNMQMQVSYDEIELCPEVGSDNPNLAPSVLDVQHRKAGVIKTELNLRGKTVNEALDETDKYLDDAFLAGLSNVRIIHGKGTGALRGAIQKLLCEHPLVVDFQAAPLNEGGAGVTNIILKD
jgi:DNA mismatch repair protein MutS2